MTRVVATERGYYGGKVIEPGEPFVVPDDEWSDEKKRPRWAVDPKAKPDPQPGHEPEPEPEPEQEPKPDPQPAPKAKPKGNGVVEAIGVQPDWVIPGAGNPEMVTK